MASTWAQVINELRQKEPAFPRATCLQFLQDTLDDITRKNTLSSDYQLIALVAGTQWYDIDQTVLNVYRVDLQQGDKNACKIDQVSLRELDIDGAEDRFSTKSSIRKAYVEPSDGGGRRIGFYNIPDQNSLVVTDASNANPIVITTAVDHGITDGATVFIGGVLGNLAANGWFFAKTSGFASDQFALYEDADFTTPVVGTGAYTSGGLVGTSNYPFVRLRVSRRIIITDDTTPIPESLGECRDALKQGAWERWAVVNDNAAEIKQASDLYASGKANLQQAAGGILSDVKPRTRPYLRQKRRVY